METCMICGARATYGRYCVSCFEMESLTGAGITIDELEAAAEIYDREEAVA